MFLRHLAGEWELPWCWPLYEYDYQCWPRPDWRLWKVGPGGEIWIWWLAALPYYSAGARSVPGLGAVCALTVVTVSTVQTAITGWSLWAPRLPSTVSLPHWLAHVRSMPGWPCHMTAAITAYIAVSAADNDKLYAARVVTMMVKHQTL